MKIRTLLPRLGGARDDVIDHAPGDRMFFTAMTLLLFFTASVAATSMTFALVTIFEIPVPVAVLVGLLWGAGILCVDRALTLQFGGDGAALVLGAVLRVLLAGVIGVVISTPLTLQIFDAEVGAEIVRIDNEERAAFQAELDSDPRLAAEPELRRSIREQEQVLAEAASADPSNDPAYASAVAIADQAVAEASRLREAWVAESNGTGGTGVPGTGPITDIAYAAYLDAQAAADRAVAAADTARASALDTLETQNAQRREVATTTLASARTELAEVVEERRSRQDAFDTASSANDGVSTRLLALHRIGVENPYALAAHVFVFLALFLIEMVPVLFKLSRRMNPTPSVHDELALAKDSATIAIGRGQHRMRVDAAETREAAERSLQRTELAVELDRHRLDAAYGLWRNEEQDRERRRAADAPRGETFAHPAESRSAGCARGPVPAEQPESRREPDRPRYVTVPAPAPVPLRPAERSLLGRVLGDRFELREPLRERGGSGRVWRAYDRVSGMEAAVKILARPGGSSEENRRAWEHEVEILRRLPQEHPNIVQILDHGLDEETGEHWLASTFYRPGSVHSVLRAQYEEQRSRPALATVLEWMIDIAAGLTVAHAHGISHGDLKPGNVVFDRNRVRIIDFGLARTVAALSPEHSINLGVGTRHFVAPEMVLRELVSDEIDPKTADLYSLGALYYWLLTSTLPRARPGDGTNLARAAWLIWSGQRPLRPLSSRVPRALTDLVEALLSAAPAGRPGSRSQRPAAAAVLDTLLALRTDLGAFARVPAFDPDLLDVPPPSSADQEREAASVGSPSSDRTFTPPTLILPTPITVPLTVGAPGDADEVPTERLVPGDPDRTQMMSAPGWEAPSLTRPYPGTPVSPGGRS